MYLFFFKFFPHLDDYRILSRVPRATPCSIVSAGHSLSRELFWSRLCQDSAELVGKILKVLCKAFISAAVLLTSIRILSMVKVFSWAIINANNISSKCIDFVNTV